MLISVWPVTSHQQQISKETGEAGIGVILRMLATAAAIL
jgi:hypothetical protein